MLLLVDAGNTRIKWALVAPQADSSSGLGDWMATGSVARAEVPLLADTWHALKITRALLSNVAGPTVRDELEQVLLRMPTLQPASLKWFSSVPLLGGIRNGYSNPAQLGCDRFASMIGAHALFSNQPLIVATCGTATTIDAVTADGLFVGGMILPGLGLMATSLACHTAQLPQIEQYVELWVPFADNTDTAIAAGCIAAQIGAIERAVVAHQRQSQSSGTVQCVLSGGAAFLIAPHLLSPCKKIDNLVLIGLQVASIDNK